MMLSFDECGQTENPHVIFLHGFCEDRSLWKNMAQRLKSNYHILCLDLPGFGKSSPQENPSMDSFAQALYETLDAQNALPCCMIGHSMGGYVTLAFAEKYPKALTGLGLFHSTAQEDSVEKKQTRTKATRFILENGSETFARSMFPNLFSPSKKEALKSQIEHAIQIAGQFPPENVAAAMLAMRDRPDRTHILESTDTPVMFIAGKDDNAVPLTSTLEQCSLPKESLTFILEDTGHMGMWEEPEKTFKAVHSFLHYCYHK